MIIHYNLETLKAPKSIITIGTFDGVHQGHHKVIELLNSIAKNKKGESVVFTFSPHPRLVLSNDFTNLRLLTTLDEKIEELKKSGIDHLVIFPFTKEFASLSYEEFISDILIGKMNMTALVVGHDHKLGKNREGSYENLNSISKKFNFEILKTDAYLIDDCEISSSKIRNALQTADIEKANAYLGYTYSISGKVSEGNQIGRSIGFPTANIESNDRYKLIPCEGVYAISIKVDNKLYKAMLNIGSRPTINLNADKRTIEAHILDFNREIYQQQVTIYFHKHIRSEKKFESLHELKTQLNKDKQQITDILNDLNFSTSS